MRHRLVCDTSVLVAYGRGEPGRDVAWAHLRRGGCVMHEVNISEIAFTMPRKHPGAWSSRTAVDWLEKVGIVTVAGFDRRWAEVVAEIRLVAPALNLGDGVAVALASSLRVPVLTADRAFLAARDFADIQLIR